MKNMNIAENRRKLLNKTICLCVKCSQICGKCSKFDKGDGQCHQLTIWLINWSFKRSLISKIATFKLNMKKEKFVTPQKQCLHRLVLCRCCYVITEGNAIDCQCSTVRLEFRYGTRVAFKCHNGIVHLRNKS